MSKRVRLERRIFGAPDRNLAEKVAVMRKVVIPEGIPARVITSGKKRPYNSVQPAGLVRLRRCRRRAFGEVSESQAISDKRFFDGR